MVLEFRFPDVGEGITEGRLVKWLVKEKQEVKADQPLAEVETDKAVVEIPSPRDGFVLKLHFEEGDTMKVGDLMISIGEKGEKAEGKETGKKKKRRGKKEEKEKKKNKKPKKEESKKKKGKKSKKDKSESKAESKRGQSVVGELPEEDVEIPTEKELSKGKSGKKDTEVKAMPSVRRLARKLSVDLSEVEGTGNNGLITENDVIAASKGKKKKVKMKEAEKQKTEKGKLKKTKKGKESVIAPGQPKVTFDKYGRILRLPLTTVRKTIVEKMNQANNIPIAVAMIDADITKLAEIREHKKEQAANKGIPLTFLPFLVRAVVAALKKHPYLNSELDEENELIINKSYYNIGVAVETNYGLMVPVVKKANSKSILEIAHDIDVLADNARKRKISLDDLKGGTFTITNYGSIGGNYGMPLVNVPETAILGVGRAEDKPVVRNKEIVVRKMLPLSLSFDHRVVDGAKATAFLKDVVKHLEDPELLLLDID